MGENKIKTTVRIGGVDYPMSGFESEEYMHRVAILVDRKISDIERAFPALSSSQAAVLAAINLADEVLKLREENEALDEKFNTWRAEALDSVKPRDAGVSQIKPQAKPQLSKPYLKNR